MLLTGIAIKNMGDEVGLSRSSAFKHAKAIINNAGHETREQFMAAEITRLRTLLRER
jgi:hypothetical protein